MPYQLVEEYCGRWWHFWWAGPNLYVHLVDVEGLPEDYCEVAQPASLLRRSRDSIPVACVPLVYRGSEDVWVVAGNRNHHYYRRADRLARHLENIVTTWPYDCAWTPVGRVPPAVYDVELLEEALRHMPILRPKPEELAVDYVAWSYRDLADFLRSEYIYLVQARRSKEKWREICEHGDPRTCYSGALGELLASIKEQGLTPAIDAALFGFRYAKPWGAVPVYLRQRVRVYYVLGRLLKAAIQRAPPSTSADSELPLLPVDGPMDPQGPIMRQRRRRKPTPSAPIALLEDFLPTTHGQERGGPLAVFDLLSDL